MTNFIRWNYFMKFLTYCTAAYMNRYRFPASTTNGVMLTNDGSIECKIVYTAQCRKSSIHGKGVLICLMLNSEFFGRKTLLWPLISNCDIGIIYEDEQMVPFHEKGFQYQKFKLHDFIFPQNISKQLLTQWHGWQVFVDQPITGNPLRSICNSF